MLESSVLRRIFVAKRDGVIEGWRELLKLEVPYF
jgi:hypothetical protein